MSYGDFYGAPKLKIKGPFVCNLSATGCLCNFNFYRFLGPLKGNWMEERACEEQGVCMNQLTPTPQTHDLTNLGCTLRALTFSHIL